MAVEDFKEISETTESTNTTGNIPNSVSVGDEAKSSDMIGSNLIVPDNDVINSHSAPEDSSSGVLIPNGEPEKTIKADLVSIGSGQTLECKDAAQVESEVQESVESQKIVENSDDQAAELYEKAEESEEKAEECEEKAEECEDKAEESEEKAEESEVKAEVKAEESEEKAEESEEKAEESEEKAAESEEKAAESEDKADESEEKATESENKAVEFEEKADQSEAKAVESEDKAVESEDILKLQRKAAEPEANVSECQDEVTTDLVETGVDKGNDRIDKQQEKEEDSPLTTKIISDFPKEEISPESTNLNENLQTEPPHIPVACTETSPPEISKSSDHGSSADLELSESDSESEMGGEVKHCPHSHQFVNDLSSNESSSDEDTVDISALRKERRQKRKRKRQQRLKKCCSGCDTQGTVEPLSPDLPDPIAMSTDRMMQCNVIKSFEEVVSTRYDSEEEIDAAISSYTAVGGRLANQNEQTFSDVDIAGYKSKSECGSPTSDPDLLVCDYSNSVGRKLANRNLNNQNDNLDECIGGFLLDSLNQNLDPTSRLFAMGVEDLKKMSEGLRMKLQKVNEDLVNVVRENDDLKAEKSVITKHVTQLSRLVQGIRANDNSAFRKILVTRETDI